MDKWMTNLPEDVTKIPLSKLAIPGSHDSCSYCIDAKSDLSEDNEAFPILRLLGDFGKVVSSQWGRTQDANLPEQLSAGIRYFDLRVMRRQSNSLFYFVHGQFAETLSTELLTIHSFLQDHPKEVVILDFNHLYCFFHPEDLSEFVAYIISVFGSMLAPRTDRIPCLKDLWEKGHQVICILHEISEYVEMWIPAKISSPWPNTVDLEKLMSFINSHPPTEDNQFHVTQGILTPDKDYLVARMNSNLAVLAAPASERVIRWIEEDVKRNQRNIFIIDFAVKMFPNFAEAVIKLNLTR
nr:PLC phosphodiesterase TIM beta alpha barrel domain [Hymenolepis microstoma]